MLDHGPGMDLCEENSECLREHSQKTRVFSPQSLRNTELFLECVFALLPSIADRSALTSDYSLLLAAVIESNV